MKIEVHIDNVFYDHEEIKDPKKIAELVRRHIAHLGNVEVSYFKWWQKLLNSILDGE